MSYTSIQTVLDTQLKSVSSSPSDFVEENERSLPANKQPWCRTTLLPAETEVIGTGGNGMLRLNGLYQIDLFFPEGYGYLAAALVADDVLAAFARGTFLTGDVEVQIESSYPQTAQKFNNTSYQKIVLVRWSVYTQ